MGFFTGYVIGAIISGVAFVYCTEDTWQDRLIEAELAEFVVDSTTGDTTFIIYAEQETK